MRMTDFVYQIFILKEKGNQIRKEQKKIGKKEDAKAERVLSMYKRLKEGKIISKVEESEHYNVAPRTIQRDLTDIQCFLRGQNSETGEIQEIVFDRDANGYRLGTSGSLQDSVAEPFPFPERNASADPSSAVYLCR